MGIIDTSLVTGSYIYCEHNPWSSILDKFKK